MPKISVGAGVLNQIPLDWEGNFQRILKAIQSAQDSDISILCLPELCLTGYGCEDQFYGELAQQKSIEYLQRLIPETKNIIVFVGLPLLFEGDLYNVSACVANQKIIGFIPKQFLADDGVHYEPRWFKAWPKGKRGQISINEFNLPMGDFRFDFAGIKIGIEICQDAWEGNLRPAHDLAKRGVSLICNPTASHFAFGKSEIRQRLSVEGSEIIDGTYLFANLLGNESGRIIFDGDAYIVHQGKILQQTNRFSFQDFQIISSEVDLKKINNGDSADLIQIEPFQIALKPQNLVDVAEWEESKHKKEEEFARVISLGLWDYLRKSFSNGFVISLSGGADSSAISTLCYLSVYLAEKELGFMGLKEKLAYIPWIQSVQNTQELIKKLMTTLYQGTVNSSESTQRSASELANYIGTTHYELKIDSIVNEYTALIENAIGRSLDWSTDDVTLQNVQARVRSPSAWMLANINNALLLATSNRSEGSVGYSTMDGDTSGSISPIAGIDKHFLRKWLSWIQHSGLNNELKIEGLHRVNSLEPSAELRPLETKQVDEEDLMPYPILNVIERLAFYDRKTPADCLGLIKKQFGNHFSEEKLTEFVHRFFKLWARNQWKRERYAPGFHVDDYSLDPKSWLRFPILSAGLAKDLPPSSCY